MHIVIKGTRTIQEYKALKSVMEQRAKTNHESHSKAMGNWKEGGISKVWLDNDGILCIEYESGHWWHYSESGEWW